MDAQQAVERIHQIERANRKRRIDTLQYGAARFSPEAEAMMNAREVWLEQELPDAIPWAEYDPPTEPRDMITELLQVMRRYGFVIGDLIAGAALAGVHIHVHNFDDADIVESEIRAELEFYSPRVAWAKAMQIAECTWQFSTERRRKDNNRTMAHAHAIAMHTPVLVRAMRTCWLWGLAIHCDTPVRHGSFQFDTLIDAFEDRGDKVFVKLPQFGLTGHFEGEVPKTHLASEERPFSRCAVRIGMARFMLPMVAVDDLGETAARVQRAAVGLGRADPRHVAGIVRMALGRARALAQE